MSFGYTPDRAEQAKDQLDQRLGQVEDGLRRLKEVVPAIGALEDRIARIGEEASEIACDLRGLVDERTETEAVV